MQPWRPLAACTNSGRFGGATGNGGGAGDHRHLLPPRRRRRQPTAPVDLAGKWKLSGAGGACLMTLTDEPGSTDGKIAPAGGCPGNFFMSRKWSYEHDSADYSRF